MKYKNLNTRKLLHLCVLIGLYFLLRLLFISSDLPPFGLSVYQPIDELYYAHGGFNLFTNGTFTSSFGDDYAPLSLFSDSISFLCLKLLGNNYYGLRFAPVICGLLVMILVYCIGNYKKDTFFSRILLIGGVCLLLFDFNFLMSNRVFEPTIFRMVAMLAVMFFIQRQFFKNLSSFYFVGLIAGLSCFFVYITNFFLIFSSFIFVIIWSIVNRKNIYTNSFAYCLGVLSGVFVFVLVLIFGFNVELSLIKNLYTSYGGRVAGGSIIYAMYENIKAIGSANFIKFNLPFFWLSLLSAIPFCWRLIKQRDTTDILIISFIIGFLCQTLFINDYPQRKLVILLPLFVLVIMRGVSYFNERVIDVKFSNIAISVLITSLISVFIFYFNRGNRHSSIYSYTMPFFEICLSVCALVLSNLVVLWGAWRKKMISLFFFFLILVPSSFFCYKHLYKSPTYSYKETCVAIEKRVEKNSVIVGGLAFGFRLYNEKSTFFLNSYRCREDSLTYKKNIEILEEKYPYVYTVMYADSFGYFPVDFSNIISYRINTSPRGIVLGKIK